MGDSILDTDLNGLLIKGLAELESALEHEANAEKQLAFSQAKVARLSERICQLAIASDDQGILSAVKETGLTEALRTVLTAANGQPLTAVEIRKRLEDIGFDVAVYQNFLATLYLTLRRLEKQNEVIEIKQDGKKTYVWLKAPMLAPLFTVTEKTRKAMTANRPQSFADRLLNGPRPTIKLSPRNKKS